MPRLEHSDKVVRWLLAPALLALMVLLGLAIGSESRAEFQERLRDGQAAGDDDAAPDGSADTERQQSSERDRPSGSGGDLDRPIASDGDSTSEGPVTETGPEISLEIRGDDGAVGVRLDPGGADVAFPRTGDGAAGLPTELTADGLPAGSGYRLSADGRLEATPVSEASPGDIVIDPTPTDGIDLARADGSRIEIRTRPGSQGEAPTIDLTLVEPDGARAPLTADGGGAVEVGDGVSIQLPTPGGMIPPMDEPATIAWRLFLLWLVSMTVASLGLAYYLWRTAPPLPFSEVFHPPAEVPVTRFVDYLAVLRMDPDAARAIRLAFQGAEGGLGSLPAREPTETPFEWHSRVAAEHPHLDAVLGSLCSRFTTARFAPERPSLADRDAAVDELEQLAYLAGYHDPSGRRSVELLAGAAP
ncbi:MAG: DUF4129 domain-containing protein [Actinomycetota bacterium]